MIFFYKFGESFGFSYMCWRALSININKPLSVRVLSIYLWFPHFSDCIPCSNLWRNIEKYVDVLLFIISISSLTPPSRRFHNCIRQNIRVSHDGANDAKRKERTKHQHRRLGDWHLCTSQCCKCWVEFENIKDSWALDGQRKNFTGIKFNLSRAFLLFFILFLYWIRSSYPYMINRQTLLL